MSRVRHAWRDDVRSAVRILNGALLTASARWRLIVIWVVGLLIPTTIVAMPLRWALLRLDWSPRSAELARHFDFVLMSDVGYDLARDSGPPVMGAVLLAILAAWLLAPLLAGATLTAARRPDVSLGFVELGSGALGWYAPLFVLHLMSLLSLGAASAVGSVVLYLADKRAEHAILESQAASSWRGAIFVTVVVYALAHAALEAARGRLAADPDRGPVRAWADGLGLLIERPLTVLALYLVPTLIGGLAMWILLAVRIRIVGATPVTFAVAWLVTQLGLAGLGWGRAGRLFALTALAAEHRETRSA